MDDTAVVTPRPASTVAIVRDGAAGVEIWMMRRHSSMAFAAGMQAFPGGAVEDADRDASVPWSGREVSEFAAVLGVEASVARALVSAAVRETFEECGVLFVSGGAPVSGDAEAARVALLDGTIGWGALLREAGASVDGSALVPWSRWITPAWSPRRFDAWFFVADGTGLADDAGPRWIDGEADEAAWFVIGDAIAAHDRGELPMLPPTITTLRQLGKHARVADVIAARPNTVTEESG